MAEEFLVVGRSAAHRIHVAKAALPGVSASATGRSQLSARKMDFRGAAAARAADSLRPLPPFPPAAERCAFACVLLIRNSVGTSPEAVGISGRGRTELRRRTRRAHDADAVSRLLKQAQEQAEELEPEIQATQAPRARMSRTPHLLSFLAGSPDGAVAVHYPPPRSSRLREPPSIETLPVAYELRVLYSGARASHGIRWQNRTKYLKSLRGMRIAIG
jgi:hypothetical protein